MGLFNGKPPPMDDRPWDYIDTTGTLDEREDSAARRDYRFSLGVRRATDGDYRPVTYMDYPDPS